jgi:hypothetical protein
MHKTRLSKETLTFVWKAHCVRNTRNHTEQRSEFSSFPEWAHENRIRDQTLSQLSENHRKKAEKCHVEDVE